MDIEKIKALLSKDYSITLRGGEIGYIINMLSDKQHELNSKAEKNITDVNAHLGAAANDVVGNAIIHAIYNLGGVDMLAFVLGVSAEKIHAIMRGEFKMPKPNSKLN